MRAIDYIRAAYSDFPLRSQFSEVEQQIRRGGTVAQVSLRSDSLGVMVKLFISEMEGEGGIYVAPLGSKLGYRDDDGWRSPWTLREVLAETKGYDDTALATLRAMKPLAADCSIQLRAELEWLVENVDLIGRVVRN